MAKDAKEEFTSLKQSDIGNDLLNLHSEQYRALLQLLVDTRSSLVPNIVVHKASFLPFGLFYFSHINGSVLTPGRRNLTTKSHIFRARGPYERVLGELLPFGSEDHPSRQVHHTWKSEHGILHTQCGVEKSKFVCT